MTDGTSRKSRSLRAILLARAIGGERKNSGGVIRYAKFNLTVLYTQN